MFTRKLSEASHRIRVTGGDSDKNCEGVIEVLVWLALQRAVQLLSMTVQPRRQVGGAKPTHYSFGIFCICNGHGGQWVRSTIGRR